jgi:hypothetical protein
MTQAPAFIAFTGVDRLEALPGMAALSARYPIEWGLLLDEAQEGQPLFPDAELRAKLRPLGLRLAAHVCGGAARAIADQPGFSELDLGGFQRVQVNHGFKGSTEAQVANVSAYGRRMGVRSMLQCLGAFPDDARVDWLFDTSFGEGVSPSAWPALPETGPFCGFAGGIGPHNAAAVVAAIAAPPGALYWIDMESRVRTDGWLDLGKCEAVCKAVYGR